jgi:hypothetical protein
MTTLLGVTDPDEVTRSIENVRKYSPNETIIPRKTYYLPGIAACSVNISILLTTRRKVVLR